MSQEQSDPLRNVLLKSWQYFFKWVIQMFTYINHTSKFHHENRYYCRLGPYQCLYFGIVSRKLLAAPKFLMFWESYCNYGYRVGDQFTILWKLEFWHLLSVKWDGEEGGEGGMGLMRGHFVHHEEIVGWLIKSCFSDALWKLEFSQSSLYLQLITCYLIIINAKKRQ